jgi:hypothetical protein
MLNKLFNFRKADFKYKGHKFFVCDPYADANSPKRLSTARALKFTLALNQLAINISREHLESFQEIQEKLLQRGDLQQALYLNRLLKVRLQLKTFEKGFLDLAKTIILVDNEAEPSNEYDSLKDELLKDEVVKGFFLQQSIRLVKYFNPSLQDIEVEDYLAQPETREIELIFQNSISSTT